MFPPTPRPPLADHQQPRILYFISRNNGTIVPLIPADELPFRVRLENVPRVLSPNEIYGLQHVGSAPFTGLTFKLENDHPMQQSSGSRGAIHTRNSSAASEATQFLPPDALARQALTHQSSSMPPKLQYALPPRPTSAHELATTWRAAPTSKPSDTTQDVIDAIISTQSGAEAAARMGYQPKSAAPTAPSGKAPDPEKKEFCTYWIRTGECDYAQQGCLYKHEMPDSLEKLQKLGFRRWPMWWQERNQQVRLGGGGAEVVSAGPRAKPSEWLKKGEDSDSDSEASENDGEKKRPISVEVKSVVKMPTTKPEAAASTPKPAMECSIGQVAPGKPHQQSATNDLISFDPLTPSTTASSLVVSTSTANSTGVATPATSINAGSDHGSPTSKGCSTSSRKVFVPAGESAETHIVQYKKRGKPVSETSISLDTQLQSLQKAMSDNGLMASKHAPRTDVHEHTKHTTDRRGRKTSESVSNQPKRPSADLIASTLRGEMVVGRKSGERKVLRPRVRRSHNRATLPIASMTAARSELTK